MLFRKYSVQMDFTGITRKRAAEILSEYFNTEYKYQGEIENYTVIDRVGREWCISKADDVDAQKIWNNRMIRANFMYQVRMRTPFLYRNDLARMEKVLEQLDIGGAILNDSTKTTVLLDIADMENRKKYMENLVAVEQSKGKLLRKALKEEFATLTDFSSIDNGIVAFPIYKSTLNFSELKGDIQLAEGISGYAESSKRISRDENNSANEKFVMRTWLVRIGMVGEEYREARKRFTSGLSGNSAWLKKFEAEEKISSEIVEETDKQVEGESFTEKETNTEIEPEEEQEMMW